MPRGVTRASKGALKNFGHVGRTTTARILKAHGLLSVPERPTSWQISLRAHLGAIAGGGLLHHRGLDLFLNTAHVRRSAVPFSLVRTRQETKHRIQRHRPTKRESCEPIKALDALRVVQADHRAQLGHAMTADDLRQVGSCLSGCFR
jgi:hypothetical protein